MPPLRSQVVLSRYFNKNVCLVAKMCQRCYEECEDITITSVNLIFLKQTNSIRELIDVLDKLVPKRITIEEYGFSEGEKEFSLAYTKTFNKTVNTFEDTVSNEFKGFSSVDLDISTQEKKKTIRACDKIRFRLYRRISIRAIRSVPKFRVSKSKRSFSDKQSKYFTIAFDNNNVGTVKIKEECPIDDKIKMETLCEHCKGHKCDGFCQSIIKSEYDDYESKYFRSLNQIISVKKEEISDKKPPIFVPPKSPHNLIEECLYHDPWALLVATIFLNRTSCMCARPYVFWFLNEHSSPLAVLEKYPKELEKYFVKLGLQKTRAVQVWRMSHDFVYKPWKNVKELYGIGAYGENAFRMFCLGDFSVEPKDRFLKIYKAWYEKIALKQALFLNDSV